MVRYSILGGSVTLWWPSRVTLLHYITQLLYRTVSVYGSTSLRSSLSRSVCSYGRVPCFQSSVFRAVFAFGFAALRKLGWKRAGHAASAKSSLSLIRKWCRRWCQSIILSTYLVFQILRIRCLHYKLRISHWELWSLHTRYTLCPTLPSQMELLTMNSN